MLRVYSPGSAITTLAPQPCRTLSANDDRERGTCETVPEHCGRKEPCFMARTVSALLCWQARFWCGPALARSLAAAGLPAGGRRAGAASNQVVYQLPADGPLPKTYCVTLAIVDPQNPAWIISQFVAGRRAPSRPRTRAASRRPGTAWTTTSCRCRRELTPSRAFTCRPQKWPADGEYHSITPRFVAGRVGLDAPARAVEPARALRRRSLRPAAGRRGRRPQRRGGLLLRLPGERPEQPAGGSEEARRLRAVPPGVQFGRRGGRHRRPPPTARRVWSFSTDGGPKFVYRADGKTVRQRQRPAAERLSPGRAG